MLRYSDKVILSENEVCYNLVRIRAANVNMRSSTLVALASVTQPHRLASMLVSEGAAESRSAEAAHLRWPSTASVEVAVGRLQPQTDGVETEPCPVRVA